MKFICQQNTLNELSTLAGKDRHSLLISGPEGCGKTYLACQYAKLLNVEDFQTIQPTVQAIKDSVDICYSLDHPVVLCIENLDTGVSAASYALLKFLEEPMHNVYVVVTCRNINNVPDTIVSRSVCVLSAPPIDLDLIEYAKEKNASKYEDLKSLNIWKCVRTFGDVDIVLNLTPAQIEYFNSLSTVLTFRDTVSNLMWKLGHYPDNSETPIKLVIRYLIEASDDLHVRQAGITCITELSSSRLAAHAVLAKFLFECKYCE